MKKFMEPEIKVTTFEYESLMFDIVSNPEIPDGGTGEWEE